MRQSPANSDAGAKFERSWSRTLRLPFDRRVRALLASGILDTGCAPPYSERKRHKTALHVLEHGVTFGNRNTAGSSNHARANRRANTSCARPRATHAIPTRPRRRRHESNRVRHRAWRYQRGHRRARQPRKSTRRSDRTTLHATVRGRR